MDRIPSDPRRATCWVALLVLLAAACSQTVTPAVATSAPSNAPTQAAVQPVPPITATLAPMINLPAANSAPTSIPLTGGTGTPAPSGAPALAGAQPLLASETGTPAQTLAAQTTRTATSTPARTLTPSVTSTYSGQLVLAGNCSPSKLSSQGLGGISGLVYDAYGAIAPYASIRLGGALSATADASGVYCILDLQPGGYMLTASDFSNSQLFSGATVVILAGQIKSYAIRMNGVVAGATLPPVLVPTVPLSPLLPIATSDVGILLPTVTPDTAMTPTATPEIIVAPTDTPQGIASPTDTPQSPTEAPAPPAVSAANDTPTSTAAPQNSPTPNPVSAP